MVKQSKSTWRWIISRSMGGVTLEQGLNTHQLTVFSQMEKKYKYKMLNFKYSLGDVVTGWPTQVTFMCGKQKNREWMREGLEAPKIENSWVVSSVILWHCATNKWTYGKPCKRFKSQVQKQRVEHDKLYCFKRKRKKYILWYWHIYYFHCDCNKRLISSIFLLLPSTYLSFIFFPYQQCFSFPSTLLPLLSVCHFIKAVCLVD